MGIIVGIAAVFLILYLGLQMKNLIAALLLMFSISFFLLVFVGILIQAPQIFFLFWLGVVAIILVARIALEPYRRKQLTLKKANDEYGHEIWLKAEAQRQAEKKSQPLE